MALKQILSHSLIKVSAIYFSFGIINKAILFLLVPILTRYLSPEEYGAAANFVTLISLIAIFAGLNIHGVVNVNYFKLEKAQFKLSVSNAFLVLLGSTSIVLVVLYAVKELFANKLGVNENWIIFAGIIAASQFSTTINLKLWLSEEKASKYGIFEFYYALFLVGAVAVFVILFEMGLDGRLWSIAISTILFSIFSFVLLYKRQLLSLRFHWPSIKDALLFGIPLIPHSVAIWAMSGMERFILTFMVGLSAAGLYTVGYQLAAIVGIVIASVNNAYLPYMMKKLNAPSESAKRGLVRNSYMVFVSFLLIAVFVSVLSIFILPYIVGNQYKDSADFIFWISLGFAFNGMYLLVAKYILYEKKMYYLSLVTVTSAIIHALSCYLFINLFGPIGAAYSTALSYFVSFVLTWLLAHKVYPMPWLACFAKSAS